MSSSLTVALLQTPWVAFGITAPRFIWLAALLIAARTLACLVRLWWLVRREERVYRHLRTQLTTLQATYGMPQRDGMVAAMYEALAQVFDRLAAAPALVSAWRRFAMQMVVRRDTMGQERFWTPESAETAFNDATVIEPRVNRSFYSAIPGVATGAGLLCTFLAILVALLNVTLENEQFRGMDTLISGLSGKFLSSIAALFVATLYVLCEKRLLHRLSQGLHALAVALDELVPHLTPARLLATMQDHLMAMQEHLATQTMTWQHFNSDLAATLRQSVNEGMGSSLERMVHTVEELNQWLRVAEFILDFGVVVVVQVSDISDACYVYGKRSFEQLVPDFWRSQPFMVDELAVPKHAAIIYHHQTWEKDVAEILTLCDIRPTYKETA